MTRLLAATWAGILGVERVSLSDNFFALGGHSLMATQVMSRVRRLVDVDLTVRALFEAPRFGDFVALVRDARRSGAAALPPLQARPRPYRVPLPTLSSGCGSSINCRARARNTTCRRRCGCAVSWTSRRSNAASTPSLSGTRFFGRSSSTKTAHPVQRVLRHVHVPIELEDFAQLDEAGQRQTIRAAIRHEWEAPFELRDAPLLRARPAPVRSGPRPAGHLPPHRVRRLVGGRFQPRARCALRGVSQGRAGSASRADRSGARDFALWQRSWLDAAAMERGLTYWKQQLAGTPEQITLPTDRPRPAAPTYSAGICSVTIPGDLAARLMTSAGRIRRRCS